MSLTLRYLPRTNNWIVWREAATKHDSPTPLETFSSRQRAVEFCQRIVWRDQKLNKRK